MKTPSSTSIIKLIHERLSCQERDRSKLCDNDRDKMMGGKQSLSLMTWQIFDFHLCQSVNLYLHIFEVLDCGGFCWFVCDPVGCSPPGSSVHGILQARIWEWVAISFSRESSQLRDQTQVSYILGSFFTV